MKKRIPVAAFMAVLVLAAFGSNAAAGPQTNQTTKNPALNQANIPNRGNLLLKPDLVIYKIWFAQWVENPNVSPLVPIKTSLKKGVKVWMVCDLANEGPGDVKGLWLLGFYIDNVMKWNNSWSDLASGKPLRGLGPYTPDAEGNHNFRCVLDVNSQIAERHEDNNNKEVLFAVIK